MNSDKHVALPPLPEPDTHCWDEDAGKDCWSHSKEQVRAYAAEAVRVALEQAATLVQQFDTCGDYTQGWQDLFADAIRAIIPKDRT